jgi:hypothetical protein
MLDEKYRIGTKIYLVTKRRDEEAISLYGPISVEKIQISSEGVLYYLSTGEWKHKTYDMFIDLDDAVEAFKGRLEKK